MLGLSFVGRVLVEAIAQPVVQQRGAAQAWETRSEASRPTGRVGIAAGGKELMHLAVAVAVFPVILSAMARKTMLASLVMSTRNGASGYRDTVHRVGRDRRDRRFRG
jgi:hypothetical protein